MPTAYITTATYLDWTERVETFYVEVEGTHTDAARRTAQSIAHLHNDAVGRNDFYSLTTITGASVVGPNGRAVLVTAIPDERK